MIRVLLWMLAISWLAGCHYEEAPFKVGINRWLGYEPLMLARQLGSYPDIDVVRLSSALDVMRALRNGNLQAAGLTLDEALTLIGEGIDLRIVLVLDYSHGADIVLADPSIAALPELAGKRIGVEMNAVGALLLRGLLEAAGLTLAQVNVESMPVSHMQHAYEDNRIDVAVSYQPFIGALLASGMKPVFSSADMPGQIVDVLVVRGDALHQREKMRQLIEGYFKTREFMSSRAEKALQRMAENQGVSRDQLASELVGIYLPSTREIHDSLSLPSGLRATAGLLVEVMKTQGQLRVPFDIDRHIDARWTEGIAR